MSFDNSFPPSPVAARHIEPSLLYSADDEPSVPSERLLDLALQAIALARTVDLREIGRRQMSPPDFTTVWPGEHYKLLAGLVQSVKPTQIVEIGTGSGLSAICMKKYLDQGAKITTFDLIPWAHYPQSVLCKGDFDDNRLTQCCEDLTDAAVFARHRDLLASAELIFIDAAKDNVMEARLFALLSSLKGSRSPATLLVLDDIRLWNMLKVWRELRAPKLDLTSFGHWSGTGLVEW